MSNEISTSDFQQQKKTLKGWVFQCHEMYLVHIKFVLVDFVIPIYIKLIADLLQHII